MSIYLSGEHPTTTPSTTRRHDSERLPGGAPTLEVQVRGGQVRGARDDEVLAVRDGVAHEQAHDAVRARGVVDVDALQPPPARVHRRAPELVRHHLAQALEALDRRRGGARGQLRRELGLGPAVRRPRAAADLVQGRARDEDVATAHELAPVAVEEGQQQRADVRAVDVGVRHDHDAAVAQLGRVEGLAARAEAERGDDRGELLVARDAVLGAALDVQDLAAQRQDGLRVAVAALLRRARRRVALDDEELRARGVPAAAVRELARQHARRQQRLAPHGVARGPGRGGGLLRARGLVRHGPERRRVPLEEVAERVAHDPVDGGPRGRRAQPALGLALELGLGQPHAEHGREALAQVLAGHVVAGGGAPPEAAVGRARHGRAQPVEVRAAVARPDPVRERDEPIPKGALAPAQRRLDAHAAALAPRHEAREGRVEQVAPHQRVAVLADAAGVAQHVDLGGGAAQVPQLEAQAGVQVGQLVHAVAQEPRVPRARADVAEHLAVGREAHGRAAAAAGGRRPPRQRRHGRAPHESQAVVEAVADDARLEPRRQRVDDAQPDAVEAAARAVGARRAAELAARVQHRADRLERRDARLRVRGARDAAAVVRHDDGPVPPQLDADARRVAARRLVHRVVEQLEDEVVQAARARRADVHAGPLAHGLEALEHRDLVGAVVRGRAARRAPQRQPRGRPQRGGEAQEQHGEAHAQNARCHTLQI